MDEGFNNKIIVDLFAGTGALGLEAVSRGSQSNSMKLGEAGRDIYMKLKRWELGALKGLIRGGLL